MKPLLSHSVALVIGLACLTDLCAQQPERLRREDSFFGIHMDHHAVETESETGKTLTEGMIDTLLQAVKPDFIQVDSKGHPGITSYPTKVGFKTQSYVGDPLKRFRKVTAERGVSLYVHFSGVWDDKVCNAHPDWAVLNREGKPAGGKVSFFSPYLDTYLIPQLKELSADYGIDGAWIDGDCWAVEVDYSPKAVEAFKKATGLDSIPKDSKHPDYMKAVNFFREEFRKYVTTYVNAIHRFNPKFQITSNWAYSSFMPEKPTIPVDFLSGDVSPRNSVNSAAFEARSMAAQKLPWDLMMWSFTWDGNLVPMNTKSPLQLKQELAEIIATGGGVQVYFRQNEDISFSPWEVSTMAELAKFCRERQPYCFKSQPVHQVALLNSEATTLKKSTRAFGNGFAEPLKGVLISLLDNRYHVETQAEHQIQGRMKEYPVIVIPQFDYYEEPFMNELKEYVRNGGNLLVIGTNATQSFKNELGITSCVADTSNAFFLPYGKDILGATRSTRLNARFNSDVKVLAESYSRNDLRASTGYPISTVTSYGKGKIGGIYFDLGTAYQRYKGPVLRELIRQSMNQLFTEPKVEIMGSTLIHQTLMEKEGRLYLNLINVGGNHENINAVGYDEVPPLRDITIKIREAKAPKEVRLQPGNVKANHRYNNGVIELKLDRLDIHTVVEVVR